MPGISRQEREKAASLLAAGKKLCRSCGEVKELEQFGQKRRHPGGLASSCRPCERARRKRYVEQNPEKAKAQQRNIPSNAPDLQRERSRRYRKEHPENINATNRRYREANREAVRDWDRRRTANLSAEELARYLARRAYYEQVRRARKRAASGSFTLAEWLELCEFCGYRCLACGKQTRLTVDHVFPLAAGGTNDIGNIQPLCAHCNSKKGTQIIDYRRTAA